MTPILPPYASNAAFVPAIYVRDELVVPQVPYLDSLVGRGGCKEGRAGGRVGTR